MSSYSPHVKTQFIRAGAGAGKTTQLIKSFMDFNHEFYQKNNRLPKVVLTTFTRKATQEVKERLLVEALKRQDQKIFEHVNKKSAVHISTIHGLFHLFLTQSCSLIGLPHELKIIDGSSYEKNLKKNIYLNLKNNPERIELLEHYPFYQLISVVKEALEVRSQIDDLSYATYDLLKKTTNDKYRNVVEMIQQIFMLVPDVPDKWQNYFEYLFELKNALGSLDPQLIFSCTEAEPRKPSWSEKNPSLDPQAHDLVEKIKKIELWSIQDTAEYRLQHEKINQIFLNLINDLYKSDQESKKKTGELTISDIETLSLKVIKEYPQAAVDFSSSWDYFMIDEYQDTSPLQVKILNELVRSQPCFIVGDPQQSIYLFRGARSEVFFEKEQFLSSQNVSIQILDRNYRSDPRLMTFINNFFQSLSTQFKPMQVRELKNDLSKIAQAYYIQCYDEAEATVVQIQKLLQQGAEPKDICVLARRNKSLMQVAQVAYRAHVPVQLQAAAGFESAREILDLTAFLKFLVNPHDNQNLVLLLRSPWFYLNDQEIFDQAANISVDQHSLWQILKTQKIDAINRLLQFQLQYEVEGASSSLKKMIEESQFLICSELLDPSGQREANVWKLIQNLIENEKKPGFSLSEYIQHQFQILQSDLGSSDSEAQPVIQPDRVSLMTVHASKGLEFKHVIVIGFTDQPQLTNTLDFAFDSQSNTFSLSIYNDEESKKLASNWSQLIRRAFNQRELDENERILYVAMTRAQESLSLVACLPKPGERSSIKKNSWYYRSRWPDPQEGLQNVSYQDQTYSYYSCLSEDTVLAHQSLMSEALPVRSSYLQKTQELIPEVNKSVTTLLSKPEAAKNFQITGDEYLTSFENLKKAQRGTDLHRLFESLKFRSLEEVLKNQNDDTELIEFLINQKEIDLLHVLKNGYTEWGFGLKISNGFLQGQIDAWAELPEVIHVLDYKTGSSKFSDKAFEQLAIYTQALFAMNKIQKNKKIVHTILYPVDRQILQKTYLNEAAFSKEKGTLI